MADFDAVVIGSGLGGLTTAALLVKQGLKVCLLEKNNRLGGYAVNYTARGHRFDVATQALGGCGEGGIVSALLRDLGLYNKLTFLPCEPARIYHFPDSPAPFIQHGFLKEQRNLLCSLYPDQRLAIETCFEVFTTLFAELQDIAVADTSPLFGFSKKYPALARYGRLTVKEFFDSLHLPEKLQIRIGARSGYCMLPLSDLSLVAFACTEMSYGGGAWMVRGGVGQLVTVLGDYLREDRVEIYRKSRVERLLFAGDKVVGVETRQGKKITGKAVVMAVDGSGILAQSEEPCAPLLAKYKKMACTGSYLVSYYQVPLDCVENMQANIEVRLPRQIIAETTKIDVYYLLIPSLVDKDSAPEGKHSFCVSVPLRAGVMPDHHERLAIRMRLEQLVVELYPRLAGKLSFLFTLGPDHFKSMTGNSNGAAYGFSQTVSQSGIYRLGNNPRIAGLYLAGHWTMPGGGIAGVMTSGKLCARAVINDVCHLEKLTSKSMPS